MTKWDFDPGEGEIAFLTCPKSLDRPDARLSVSRLVWHDGLDVIHNNGIAP